MKSDTCYMSHMLMQPGALTALPWVRNYKCKIVLLFLGFTTESAVFTLKDGYQI
jgi:hypothetical protein